MFGNYNSSPIGSSHKGPLMPSFDDFLFASLTVI